MNNQARRESIKSCVLVCESCGVTVELHGYRGYCAKCGLRFWVRVQQLPVEQEPPKEESDRIVG